MKTVKFLENTYIVTWRLNAGSVQSESMAETSIATQRITKHVSVALDRLVETKALLRN
jgi:hypothetical protein